MPEKTGSDEEAAEFAAYLRQQVCAAFDVKPWQIGLAPVPWHVRLTAPLRRWRYRRTWREDGDG